MLWPLQDCGHAVPVIGPGSFGAVRKFDIHTGVDLYADPGTLVVSICDGVVTAVLPFTGPEAESPWWNSTSAILVNTIYGTALYGEVSPLVCVGDRVPSGTVLGRVATVLKHDKGKPMSMLHFELYVPGILEPVWWKLGEPRPQGLLDPTPLLLKCVRSRDNGDV